MQTRPLLPPRLAVCALAVAMFALGACSVSDAQLLSDSTGLVNRMDVAASDGRVFEIVVTSNFDVTGHEFDADAKVLRLHTGPMLSRGIAEIVIPAGLLSGPFEVSVDGASVGAKTRSTGTISFLVLEFERGDEAGYDDDDNGNRDDNSNSNTDGSKAHLLDIAGTATSLSAAAPGVHDDAPVPVVDGRNAGSEDAGGGCLVATAAFGSELEPRVQFLREVRDSKISTTESGRAFLAVFNAIYYSFSPEVADLVRENPPLGDAARMLLLPMLSSLGILGHAETGSEVHVLAYGSALLLLNLGAYMAVPAAAVAAAVLACARPRP